MGKDVKNDNKIVCKDVIEDFDFRDIEDDEYLDDVDFWWWLYRVVI